MQIHRENYKKCKLIHKNNTLKIKTIPIISTLDAISRLSATRPNQTYIYKLLKLGGGGVHDNIMFIISVYRYTRVGGKETERERAWYFLAITLSEATASKKEQCLATA